MRILILLFVLSFSSFTYSAPDRNVTFNFQRIEISDALQLLADYKQQNIVLSPEIQGEITMKLDNVPWDDAFDYVMGVANLISFSDKDTILVTRPSIDYNQSPEAPPEHPISIFKLSNALPTEVASIFHLYPSESLLPSDDLSYIVAHLPQNRVDELSSLITALDVERSQILIEARIVEVNRDYVEALGVNWGENSIVSGGWSASGSSLLTAPSASQVALGFISSRLVLDTRLSAMESEGKGNIVSSPKVFVFDRRSARIAKGFEIPYQETQAEGVVTTSFKEASLSLDVFPKVSGSNILLDIKLHKDEPDFSKSVSSQPPISTSSFSSSVRLQSGQTIAIGGVFSSSQSNSTKRVPFFSRIPVLGKLFRSRQTNKLDSELFLFLTATLAE